MHTIPAYEKGIRSQLAIPKNFLKHEQTPPKAAMIMPKVPELVRTFAPEQWGTFDYFHTFYITTYQFTAVEQRALSGVSAHFRKAQYLIGLSQKLRPNLEIDAAELEEYGHSSVHNSYELGTVIEATILEIYSVIDCTVKSIRAVHGKTSRGFKDSTSGFFKNIDKIDGTIPEEIRQLVRDATWYDRLVRIRSEIAHLTPGFCDLDTSSNLVRYMHTGITEEGKILIIDDIFEWINNVLIEINHFIGTIFYYLSANLEDKPVFQMCGMVEGRALHRHLRPSKPQNRIDFNSGECGAWIWFEQPEFPTCPFAGNCGAYNRKYHQKPNEAI